MVNLITGKVTNYSQRYVQSITRLLPEYMSGVTTIGTVKWWETKPNTGKTCKNQFHLPEDDWEGLKTTCVQLDIGPPLMVNWQLCKKGIYWTVSDECNARSCVRLTAVMFLLLLSSPLTRFWFSQAHVLLGGVRFTSSNYSIKTFLQRFHKSFAFGPG